VVPFKELGLGLQPTCIEGNAPWKGKTKDKIDVLGYAYAF
jgi:hypothetical protein